jgi:hypothetical protein
MGNRRRLVLGVVISSAIGAACVGAAPDVPGGDDSGVDATASRSDGGANHDATIPIDGDVPPNDAGVDANTIESDTGTGGGGDASVGCTARTYDDTTGIFISPGGSDTASCGTRANPCKTLTYTFVTVSLSNKTTAYLASGTYVESITLLAGLSVEGGWSANGSTWTPICDSTTSTAVTIQGATNTTVTAAYSGTTTLRDVRIVGQISPGPSESIYGISATGAATNLTLDQVIVTVGPGGVGSDASDAGSGANGDGECPAGNGTTGVKGPDGNGADSGAFTQSGYAPVSGVNGANGTAGTNGTPGAGGSCATCQSVVGACPSSCGYGSQTVCGDAGTSGCGGGEGLGGGAGTGGGSSVGVYVWGAHVTCFGGSVTSGGGGNGGNGAGGGSGGTSSAGAVGASQGCATQLSNVGCGGVRCTAVLVSSATEMGGAAGGSGGVGGNGGHGGGGAGGFSYAVYVGNDGGVSINGGTVLAHGDAGVGGANGGATGQASNQYP